MKDPCGNYVLQKFFEHGTVVHKQVLLNQMKGQVPELSKHTYGCRVVQSVSTRKQLVRVSTDVKRVRLSKTLWSIRKQL